MQGLRLLTASLRRIFSRRCRNLIFPMVVHFFALIRALDTPL